MSVSKMTDPSVADGKESPIPATEEKKKKEAEKRRDKKLLEEELKRIEKEKAEEDYDRWKLKEDEFLKRQLIEQSKIRIESRREEPIDYFMKILFVYKGEQQVDDYMNAELMKHPKKIVDRLNKPETESLLEKCDMYKKLERVEDFKTFWDHVRALALYHQERLIKYELKKRGNINIQSAISEEYNEDIEAILKGKSSTELSELEEQAKSFLNSADLNVDIEFWDQVLNRLQVQKAVMGLEKIHKKYFEGNRESFSKDFTLGKREPLDVNSGGKPAIQYNFLEKQRSDPLSPRVYKNNDLGSSIKTFTEDEYRKRLESLRTDCYNREVTILKKKAEREAALMKASDDVPTRLSQLLSDEEEDGDLNEEARRFKEIMKVAEHKADDEDFNLDEIEQPGKAKDWIDKFKPRKPHYFNRVKMGYEWNRVNQAHYDLETPPPKQVLGYKFNIFYPNMICKDKPPTYELVATDNPEFCVIRFMAGPPYEDLAFKIVNREWDYSDRKGFKCVFDRGILHLHFNFKIARYRR